MNISDRICVALFHRWNLYIQSLDLDKICAVFQGNFITYRFEKLQKDIYLHEFDSICVIFVVINELWINTGNLFVLVFYMRVYE